jgi:hypothetical protein
LVYASASDLEGICHVSSMDSGETWSASTCIPRTDTVRDREHEVRPRLAVDSEGTLHVVWVLVDYSPLSNLAYAGRAVYYARSTDGGETWMDVIAVEEVDGRDESYEGRQPEWGNVAVDGEDNVHVVWIGKKSMSRYHQWSADGGVTWSAPQVAIPAGGYNGWQGLAVDGAGVLHLVWPSLGDMIYVRWDGYAWSPPQSLPGQEGNAHQAQAVVALGNEFHVAWQDHGGDPSQSAGEGLILHAMTLTAAPHREMQPLPTPVPTLTSAATPGGEPTAEPTQQGTVVPPPIGAGSLTTDDQLLPVLLGLAPALILVSVVLFRRVRKM